MYKANYFFQKIHDLPAFEEFLSKQIIPQLLEAPKVCRVQITSLGPSVDPYPENLKPIQVFLELYFQSNEDIYTFMSSSEGSELTSRLINNSFGESGTLLGYEQALNPTLNSHNVGGDKGEIKPL